MEHSSVFTPCTGALWALNRKMPWKHRHRAQLPTGADRAQVPASLASQSLQGTQKATLKQGLWTSNMRWLNSRVTEFGLRQKWGLQGNNAQIISYSPEPKLLLIHIFGKGAGRIEALRVWCVVLSASCHHCGYSTPTESQQCFSFNSPLICSLPVPRFWGCSQAPPAEPDGWWMERPGQHCAGGLRGFYYRPCRAEAEGKSIPMMVGLQNQVQDKTD